TLLYTLSLHDALPIYRRVRGVRIVRRAHLPHHRRSADALERIVGVLEVLEPVAPLRGVGRRPARARPERVQVLVDEELAQRIGRSEEHTSELQSRFDL